MSRRAIVPMRELALVALVTLLALSVSPERGAAQAPALRRAEASYRDLAFAQTIAHARRALDDRLNAPDRARAYELLGFSYAALDSARQSTEAFKQLLLLDPDRELDPGRISPKITSLFALALGQVLVVRHLGVDSAEFVAGQGSVPIRYTVTRAARVRARIVGPDGEAVVDSSLADGTTRIGWNGLLSDGRAATTGSYRVIVEAAAGRDSYATSFTVRIDAGAVDTLAHLTELPGYAMLPEREVPPRSWKPLGIALLTTTVAGVAAVGLESDQLGGAGRTQLLTVGAVATVAGVLATVKRPAPVPVEANIRYNALVREQLARRNAEIAAENERRRRQVRLVVVPATPASPTQGAGDGAP